MKQSRKKQGSHGMAKELLLIKAISLSLSFGDEIIHSHFILCLHINHIPHNLHIHHSV